MAKTDNLTDFLTDVANAIRAKKGTSGAIAPQDFSDEIASISGGGSVDFTTTNALLDELQVAVGAYPVMYSITNTLIGCTSSNNATEIAENTAYSANITASSSYTLTGATVSITMGGVDITSTAYNNGVISIASVTGNLIITITAAYDNVVAYATPQTGVSYTPITDLSNYTDDEINLMSMAISNCQDIDETTSTVYFSDATSLSIGATRSYELSTEETMTDEILGFNHDTLTSSTAYGSATATGKAGITWQMQQCLSTLYSMNGTSNTNAGGWNASVMRTETLPTIKLTLPQTMQNILKFVNKKAASGGSSGTAITSSDDLFLLAMIEITNNASSMTDGANEGTQYKLWSTRTNSSQRVKKYDNNGTLTTVIWVTRSNYSGSSSNWGHISTGGSAGSSKGSVARGVSFAYCT